MTSRCRRGVLQEETEASDKPAILTPRGTRHENYSQNFSITKASVCHDLLAHRLSSLSLAIRLKAGSLLTNQVSKSLSKCFKT